MSARRARRKQMAWSLMWLNMLPLIGIVFILLLGGQHAVYLYAPTP